MIFYKSNQSKRYMYLSKEKTPENIKKKYGIPTYG